MHVSNKNLGASISDDIIIVPFNIVILFVTCLFQFIHLTIIVIILN